MRNSACLRKAAWCLAISLAPGLHAGQGVLAFVFGPSSPVAARQSARAAAATARHWVTAGGVVELRRSGNPDVRRIDAAGDAKEMEQTFVDAAFAERYADPSSFLIALDAAAQAAVVESGARVLVAVLNSPSFSGEEERSLENLGQLCQDHAVRVLVFDLSGDARRIPSAALNALVAKSGGAWVRQSKDLAPQVDMVTPPDESSAPAAPAAAETKAAEARSSNSAPPPFEIPVQIRLVRTSGTGATSG